jgi:hypothetical protein
VVRVFDGLCDVSGCVSARVGGWGAGGAWFSFFLHSLFRLVLFRHLPFFRCGAFFALFQFSLYRLQLTLFAFILKPLANLFFIVSDHMPLFIFGNTVVNTFPMMSPPGPPRHFVYLKLRFFYSCNRLML